ncbi:MAG: energy transducer TonB [Pyrinomonadaceae bacterium]
MGKIVKFCSTCDESFSSKFGFCPNCANPLETFELNPVEAAGQPADETPLAIDDAPSMRSASASVGVTEPVLEIPEEPAAEAEANIADEAAAPVFPEYTYAAEPQTIEVSNADFIESEAEGIVEEEAEVETVWAAPRTEEVAAEASYTGTGLHNYEPGAYTKEDDGGYYVTVIQEKNVRQRNMLLLGSSIFILTVAVGATVISLFQKDLGVGAIGDERSLALLLDDVPMPIEEEPKKEKDDDGGGGGGGGKEDPEPVNQGDLPDQSPNPTRPPDPKIPRLENPSLELPPPQTEGTRKTEKNFDRWGDPNSRFGNLSSGPGTGGGMGTGAGTGAGSGRGTGMGSGTGSGSGSGFGDGDGPGSGSGRGDPPPPRVGVTSPVKILSKPQAKYNDAGRTNGVQGSVRLKVTLLANGTIGSITPVTRLPHGLTEQAIAAARQIRFEPAKQNGIPVSRTVTIDYTFSIY